MIPHIPPIFYASFLPHNFYPPVTLHHHPKRNTDLQAHTFIHIYIHTCIPTYIHTYIHKTTYTQTHTSPNNLTTHVQHVLIALQFILNLLSAVYHVIGHGLSWQREYHSAFNPKKIIILYTVRFRGGGGSRNLEENIRKT